MNSEIKKCADKNDIKGLRYIFADCLDVDPTFKSYEEDYEYCKKLKDFFVEYKEITPFKSNISEWNEDYWVKLKVDLLKNFSEKRFLHMIEVAKVVKADKIKRLEHKRREIEAEKKRLEREKQATASIIEAEKKAREEKSRILSPENHAKKQQCVDPQEQQRREIEEEKRRLEREKQVTDSIIEAEKKAREEKSRMLREDNQTRVYRDVYPNDLSKKVMGIVIIVLVVILIIVLIEIFH